jgi:hypothetical protein
MAAVSMLKVTDVEVVDDPRAVRPLVPELVDQYAWYVTVVDPIEVPSVYVVTASQERVSAWAAIAVARMASRKTKIMVTAFRLTLSPFSTRCGPT